MLELVADAVVLGVELVADVVGVVAPLNAAPMFPIGTESEPWIPMPWSGLRSSRGSWCGVPPLSTKSASAL